MNKKERDSVEFFIETSFKRRISLVKNYFNNLNIISDNEADRLEALRRYEILDTPPENAFNNIVKIACRIYNVPIALISLVDKDRVFFKANMGMPGVTNAERGKSLCSLAILSEDITVFEDAIKEPCLLSNPLVAGSFGLRFYAGAPLKTSDGYNIGTLCIIDKVSRVFTNDEKETLQNLASIIMDEIELRLSSIKAIRNKQELLDVSVLKNNELIKKNSDLDNFIYTASHDLKAPVSNIEGLMHSLKDVLPEESQNEEVKMVMELIGKSIEKFKLTIEDLTEISKIQKNLQDDLSDINISELFEDIEVLIQDVIKESDASIKTEFSDFPTIKFSKINMQSILYNLLSNAIKYRDPKRTIEISVKTEKVDDYICLQIKDNGLGIDKYNQDKIFDMFKRAHSHVEGSGVGLYLVKRIVDNAGGKIEVESEVGSGSTFNIFFKENMADVLLY